jgi:hypothetical protein
MCAFSRLKVVHVHTEASALCVQLQSQQAWVAAGHANAPEAVMG